MGNSEKIESEVNMTPTTQHSERCLNCKQDLDPDEPHWATLADYYYMRAGAQKLSNLECQWSETIASYCPHCIAAFDVDRFVFGEPVPTSQPRKEFNACSYCDGVIQEEGEYLFVLHVVEFKYAEDAQHLLAHSAAHAVVCPNCDGAIDPLAAILPKKQPNFPSEQFPEPGI